jgi:hypothetical protein
MLSTDLSSFREGLVGAANTDLPSPDSQLIKVNANWRWVRKMLASAYDSSQLDEIEKATVSLHTKLKFQLQSELIRATVMESAQSI